MFELVATVFAIISFLTLAAGFLTYLIYVRTIESNRSNLRKLGGEIRQLERKYRSVQAYALGYPIDEPEPYGSQVAELTQILLDIEFGLIEIKRLYGDGQDTLNSIRRLSLKEVWLLPSLFRELKLFDIKIHNQVRNVDQELGKANRITAVLDDMGWVVAQDVQTLLKKLKETSYQIERIHQNGLKDNQSEMVAKKLKDWEITLTSQVPAIFYSENRSEFEQKTDRNLIVAVFKTLSPANQDVEPVIKMVVNWLDAWDQFIHLKDEIVRKKDDISLQEKGLSSDPVLRVMLDENGELILKLFGSIEQELSPLVGVSEFDVINRRLTNLRNQINNIYDRLNVVSTARQYVKSTTSLEQINHRIAWVQGAHNMLETAKRYHPDNWRNEGIEIAEIEKSLDLLFSQYESLLEILKPGSIKESILLDTQNLIEKTSKLYGDTQTAYNNFSKNYQKIQAIEREGREMIIGLHSVMNQIRAVTESNPLIKQKSSKNLERMAKEISMLENDFNQSELGSVLKKFTRLKTFILKTEGVLDKWVGLLDQEILEKKSSLSKTVNILQDMVALSDPIYTEILTLLRDSEIQNSLITQTSPTRPLAPVSYDLKRKSDLWHKLSASIKSLEEISGPILLEFERLEKLRVKLIEKMELGKKIIPEQLAWPPTTQRLSTEREEFRKLEEQFNSFKKTRVKAIQLMSSISSLSDQYRELLNTVTRVINQAEQEHKLFTDLEHRLQESKQLWSQQIRKNKDNLILVDEIENLLATCDQDFVELQKRYSNGSIAYQQAFQMLRVLCRKIDGATVQTGANQIMDITGYTQQQI